MKALKELKAYARRRKFLATAYEAGWSVLSRGASDLWCTTAISVFPHFMKEKLSPAEVQQLCDVILAWPE